MTDQLAAFAGVFAALFVAHQVADHWVQTQHQCDRKGLPGRVGRWNCAKHVATYSLTGALALVALAAATDWRPQVGPLLAGLLVSAVTHYWADRRAPLKRLAYAIGKDRGWVDGGGLYPLDQSFHYAWLFVAALIIAT
jgi:hypothetical protein